MPTLRIIGHRRASFRRRDAIVIAVTLVLAGLFLFAGPARPIFLWDESRNIINALEMDRRGLGIVTTYRGAPDLWNTKPPLLIWLMVGSVRLFGASLFALRLPGMMATLGTIAIIMVFVRRTTGSIGTAALAAALFAASPALFGEHGAGTADYDSLLVFFVTAYLALLFGAIHHRRPAVRTLLLAGLCIVGAILTKSVAGVMPGVGVAVHLVLTRRLHRVLDRRYGFVGAAVIGALLTFATAREIAVPGYLAASWHNDIAGRFSASLAGVRKPPTFYLSILWAGYFSATLLLIVAPFVLRGTPGRTRAALRYSLCIAATLVVTTTIAASKLHHYILPAMPFMAVAAAITARGIWQRCRVSGGPLASALAIVGVVAMLLATERGVAQRYLIDPAYEGAAAGRYGILFERIGVTSMPIVAVDPGFADHGDPHYAPVLDAYRLLRRANGTVIARSIQPTGRSAILASCDPPMVEALLGRGGDIGHVPGCAAIAAR